MLYHSLILSTNIRVFFHFTHFWSRCFLPGRNIPLVLKREPIEMVIKELHYSSPTLRSDVFWLADIYGLQRPLAPILPTH